MPTYNKLVRDPIQEMITNNSKTLTYNKNTRWKEYIEEVCKKTGEELTKHLEAKNKDYKVEKLANLYCFLIVLCF